MGTLTARMVATLLFVLGCISCGDSSRGVKAQSLEVIPAPDIHNIVEKPGSTLGIVNTRVDPGLGSSRAPLAGKIDLVVEDPTPPGTKLTLEIRALDLTTVTDSPNEVVISGGRGTIAIPLDGGDSISGEVAAQIDGRSVLLHAGDSALYPGPPYTLGDQIQFHGLLLVGNLSETTTVTIVIFTESA